MIVKTLAPSVCRAVADFIEVGDVVSAGNRTRQQAEMGGTCGEVWIARGLLI